MSGIATTPSYHMRQNRDRTVLVAVENPQLMEQIVTVLRLEGFQTRQFFSPELLEASLANPPDAIVLGSHFNGESVLPTLQAATKIRGVPTLVVLSHIDVDAVVAIMKTGASDVFTQPLDAERLVRSVVDTIHRSDAGTGSGEGPARLRSFYSLTNREREVLELIVDGKSNKQAAVQLGISPRTIEVHRAHCMEKLNAKNTAHLMRIVLGA